MVRRRYWLAFIAAAIPSLGLGFTLKTLIMPGRVIEGHAKIEETCESCHEDKEGERQGELCLACHRDVRTDVLAGIGFHGRSPDVKSADCYTCHDEHEGRNADILGLRLEAFTHVHTDFPLLGAHEQVTCEGCHASGAQYREAPRQCADCHAGDDVHSGALSQQCGSCHVAAAWRDTSFDHGAAFPLLGKHAATPCADCHANRSFATTPTECASCHRADDAHAGRNGTQCGTCHNAVAWPVANFDHAGLTGFTLRGSHRQLACESCHVANLTAALPSTCEGCHRSDDPHEGGLGPKCGDCHGPVHWTETKFDHAAASGFALAGAHADLACTSCHAAGVTAELDRECASCHDDDPHRGQLGARCESCHAQHTWLDPPRFDHGLIAFPLLGKHAALQCSACHATPAFHDAGDACTDCHAKEDPHGGTFGAVCATCHTPVDWHATSFDHAAITGFALSGAHARVSCAGCHTGKRQELASAGAPACGQCHRQDDPHGGRFGADCAACHGPESFGDVRRR
jgi:hypothetical protein